MGLTRFIYLVPCDSKPEGGYAYQLLKDLASRHPESRFRITEDPDQADYILFSDYEEGALCRWIRKHPLTLRYPEKIFFFNEHDAPPLFMPGVYASIRRSWLQFGRMRNYCYLTAHAITRNPYITYTPESPQAKDLLFSFLGGSTSWIRKRLFCHDFSRPDVLIENTQNYAHWDFDKPGRDAMQRRFAEVCKRSHFVLCPRGAGLSSIRLYEVMEMGLSPVILADNWRFPEGPDWESFAIILPERSFKALPQVLEARLPEAKAMGQKAREAWENYFAPDKHWAGLMHALERIQSTRRIPEASLKPLWVPALLWQASKRSTRQALRYCILKLFTLLGRRFPYSTTRP